MQISLKLIQGINHAKSTVCIKFPLLVTFSFLFTASSSLSVFPRSVLYMYPHMWCSVSTNCYPPCLPSNNSRFLYPVWINTEKAKVALRLDIPLSMPLQFRCRILHQQAVTLIKKRQLWSSASRSASRRLFSLLDLLTLRRSRLRIIWWWRSWLRYFAACPLESSASSRRSSVARRGGGVISLPPFEKANRQRSSL